MLSAAAGLQSTQQHMLSTVQQLLNPFAAVQKTVERGFVFEPVLKPGI